MSTVVGFISEKGGVGKTTTCYHIAIALHRFFQKRVLVVDTDYQRGGITCRFIPEMIESFHSGYVRGVNLFDKFQQLYSANQSFDYCVGVLETRQGPHIIPADPRLSQVTVDKMPSSKNIRENNKQLFRHLSLIKDVLDQFYNNYDYILIDSHPEISDLLRSVIYACDYCVSPVKLDLQSTIGVPSAQQAINEVNADIDLIIRSLGPVDNYSRTTFAGAIGMMAREWGGDLKQTERSEYNRLRRTGGVFENWVTEGDGLRQAAAARCAVYDIGGANANKQTDQFIEVTKEFLQKCP